MPTGANPGSTWCRRTALVAATLALGLPVAAAATPVHEPLPQTQEVFRRFAGRVVQVRIVDRGSSSKSSIGSGFFVQPAGYLVTNYHVVADVVHHPEEYRAELVDQDGATEPAELRNVDVVHDLAVLRAEKPPAAVLGFAASLPPKGTRLFSMGNPRDLGASIVEGTFNGLIEESLYEKIHFTGALNPGMSGGPALTPDGRVAGVNVATAGNALGFLVPARFAARLVAATTAPGFQAPSRFLDLVREQLVENQQAYMTRLLAAPFPTVVLGSYRLPGRLAPFVKCWGDTVRDEAKPYERVEHVCSTEDRIYVGRGQSSGTIGFRHRLVTSAKLNRFQFSSLYEQSFDGATDLDGQEEYVTGFRCRSGLVEHDGSSFKVVLCLRGYRKLAGLYDAVLKAASLNRDGEGLLTSLTLAGVSFETATRFAGRYLQTIAWIR